MSKSVFVIQNQDNHYLDTEDQWSLPDGEHAVFASPHRDVAINKLFEMTLHDPQLRGKVVTCPADERGKPLIDRMPGESESTATTPHDGHEEQTAVDEAQ